MEEMILYFDGGSRSNPGDSGYGAVLFTEKGDKLAQTYGYLGHHTNNYAEYNGLIAGLELVKEILSDNEGNDDIPFKLTIYADSKLVVEQMSGRWKIKDPILSVLAGKAFNMLPQENITYNWVPRAKNKDADRLANKAMDSKSNETVFYNFSHTKKIVSENDKVMAEDVSLSFITMPSIDFPIIQDIKNVENVLKKYNLSFDENIFYICDTIDGASVEIQGKNIKKYVLKDIQENMQLSKKIECVYFEILHKICETNAHQNAVIISSVDIIKEILNFALKLNVVNYCLNDNSITIVKYSPEFSEYSLITFNVKF